MHSFLPLGPGRGIFYFLPGSGRAGSFSFLEGEGCALPGRGVFPFRKWSIPPCRGLGLRPLRGRGGFPLLGCTPLFFFSLLEKKKSAVHGGEEKEGLDSRLGGSRSSILLCRWIEHCAAWCPVVTLLVLLTALRAGAGGKVLCVQIRAEMALRCAAGRARTCAVLGMRAVRSAFFVVH